MAIMGRWCAGATWSAAVAPLPPPRPCCRRRAPLAEPLTAPARSPAPAGPVPEAVAPPPRNPRFPLVDGLRAVAAVCVVAVHAALFGGALSTSLLGRLLAHLNIGVTIFFLISGFLLYRPFIAHRGDGGRPPAVTVYGKRRMLRIFPAYWLILTVLLVLPGFTPVVGGNWWPMYTLTHTLPLYTGQRCATLVTSCSLAQTWSLVVELTFYLVLPLYALAVRRLTRGLQVQGWAAVELTILITLSAASVLTQYVALKDVPTWFSGSVLGYVLWFALGMAMAVISVGWKHSSSRISRVISAHPLALWTLAGLGYLGLSAWLPATPFVLDRFELLVTHVTFGLIAALVLAPAVFADGAGGLPRRALAHPQVAWLGLVSYGIFLWHYPIVLKLGTPGAGLAFVPLLVLALGLSTACAAASYYLLERPALRLKNERLGDLRRRWSARRAGGF